MQDSTMMPFGEPLQRLRLGRAANGIATFDGRLAPPEESTTASTGIGEACHPHGHHSLFRSDEADALGDDATESNSDRSSFASRERLQRPSLRVGDIAPGAAYAELDAQFSYASGTSPSTAAEGANMCGGFSLRGKVPTAAATLLILTAGVLAITGSALGISIAFSIQSAQALARTNAAAAFSLCHDAITESVVQPKKFAQTVQFNAATLPTPQDPFRPGFDIANETWQRPWQDMLLNNLHRSGFALNDAAIVFADSSYVACQPNNSSASLASCVFVPTPLFSEELGIVAVRRDEVRSRIDGTVLSTTIGPSELIGAEFVWFVFTPRVSSDDFRWSDVYMLDNTDNNSTIDNPFGQGMRPGNPPPACISRSPSSAPAGSTWRRRCTR